MDRIVMEQQEEMFAVLYPDSVVPKTTWRWMEPAARRAVTACGG